MSHGLANRKENLENQVDPDRDYKHHWTLPLDGILSYAFNSQWKSILFNPAFGYIWLVYNKTFVISGRIRSCVKSIVF